MPLGLYISPVASVRVSASVGVFIHIPRESSTSLHILLLKEIRRPLQVDCVTVWFSRFFESKINRRCGESRGTDIPDMKKSLIAIVVIIVTFFFSTNAQKYEPKWIGQVVALSIDNDTISKTLEKASVQVKTKQSAGRLLAGIGPVRQKAYIKGNASPVQFDPTKPIILIVRCKDNETDPSSIIQIVEFERGRKERRTELSMQNWLGNTSEGNMKLIPFEADSYGSHSYIITLPPIYGEFGVRIVNPDNLDEKVPIFNCFGTSSYDSAVAVNQDLNTTDAMD